MEGSESGRRQIHKSEALASPLRLSAMAFFANEASSSHCGRCKTRTDADDTDNRRDREYY